MAQLIDAPIQLRVLLAELKKLVRHVERTQHNTGTGTQRGVRFLQFVNLFVDICGDAFDIRFIFRAAQVNRLSGDLNSHARFLHVPHQPPIWRLFSSIPPISVCCKGKACIIADVQSIINIVLNVYMV